MEEMEIKDRGILNITKKVENGELIFCFLHDLGLRKQSEIAVQLSNLTHSDETVLNMSPDDIMEKACVALLFDEKGKMIASASLMQPQLNSFGQRLGEIGSMFTIEKYQNQGCASFLVYKIDEWAKKQSGIDGAYAFLNSKSPRSFAVNGYKGELRKEGVLYNAADITPAYAFNLCRTICRNEHAIHLMDLELRKKELQDSESNIKELDKINEELCNARIKRQVRFESLIRANESKICNCGITYQKKLSAEQIKQDVETHYKIINFYIDNFKNNLHCCDVVVAKLF